MLRKLTTILSSRDKKYLLLLLFLSLLIALIETLGITAIMPYLKISADPQSIFQNQHLLYVYDLIGAKNEKEFLIFFGVSLIIFYIFRGVANTFYMHLLNHFAFSRYHLIVMRLFDNYLSMSYLSYTTKNSAFLTKMLVTEANNVTQVLKSALFLFSELLIVILLYVILLVVNFKITLVLTVIIGVKILLLTRTISTRIKKIGQTRYDKQQDFYRIIDESFGNFKFIKLISNQKRVKESLAEASWEFSKSNIMSGTLTVLPRHFLETFAFVILVAIMLYVTYRYNDITAIIPIISMYALALYRLLPSVNRILSSYNLMMFNYKSLDTVHHDVLLKGELNGGETIVFNSAIELEQVSFAYGNDDVLKNISLKITKGEKVAFIGPSGSGKSTLVDLLMSIHLAENGTIKIDGKSLDQSNVQSWRKKIGYIPQAVYLFDGSVAENIAFGAEYDETKIIEVLKKARIYDFLIKKQGIYTHIGQNGIQLSGGQKQRIAIARALYNDPEVLVLDEATSALDENVEKEIMDEIYHVSKEKTLLIIAHRLSTIQQCDRIIELENGEII